MKTFVARYGSAITATLSGFDRLVFRGTLIPLVIPRGMHVFLHHAGVRLLDYKQYVVRTSERIKEASLRAAVAAGRPIRDLQSTIDKEDLARELLDRVARPVTYHGRRWRALRIGDPADVALLHAISRGEFATAGLRNRDLQTLLYPSTRAPVLADARRRSARISRQLRLLRTHGVIKKVPKTHRYQLTPRGRLLTAALSAVRETTLQKLVGSAAA